MELQEENMEVKEKFVIEVKDSVKRFWIKPIQK